MSEYSGVEVTLKRQRGDKAVGFGITKEVDCAQSIIFINGQFAGYAPDEGQISIIAQNVEAGLMEHIKSEVERLRPTLAPASGIVQMFDLNAANVELVQDEASEPAV